VLTPGNVEALEDACVDCTSGDTERVLLRPCWTVIGVVLPKALRPEGDNMNTVKQGEQLCTVDPARDLSPEEVNRIRREG
jgi:hypothetical protein